MTSAFVTHEREPAKRRRPLPAREHKPGLANPSDFYGHFRAHRLNSHSAIASFSSKGLEIGAILLETDAGWKSMVLRAVCTPRSSRTWSVVHKQPSDVMYLPLSLISLLGDE